MKIAVCIRQGLDGDISPFDACAYEEALKIQGAEVILVSMGAPSVSDLLLKLTRLGAARAILLSDKAFAGADTLATAYALSLAIQKISPDLVFCGRQTLVGDTAQTPVMLGQMLGYGLITNVMSIDRIGADTIECTTRCEGAEKATIPALITVERINTLRLPRLRSKLGVLEMWNAEDVGADLSRCGLKGSPTRVLKTFENQSGKRKCTFISRDKLEWAIEEGLKRSEEQAYAETENNGEKLLKVFTVTDAPMDFAKTVSDNVTDIGFAEAEKIAEKIKRDDPDAVIWGSDTCSKRLSSQVAVVLGLGLCADCTRLECENGELIMYRPALSGSIIAKIKSLTRPAMATVRTDSTNAHQKIIVAAGFGVKDKMDDVRSFADGLGAELCATRKLVDNGYAQYDSQVGLTGKTVSPPIYIAIGVSGAIHHIAGMQRSGTVIAINPDKDAPIFEYADYGIIDNF